jgi:CheY-like chemotaxis protein
MDTKKRALIVDDEPDARMVVSGLLQSQGWETIEGEDGTEAVALASRENPDLVILDVMMPGKDGFDVLRELREDSRTQHIPVIMLTAINDIEMGERHDAESTGHRLGVTAPQAFVDKPFEFVDMLAVVDGAVEN